MNKKRIIYFCLLFMCILFISITYFSYAFLTSKKEVHGKLNIVAGTLDYKIVSNDIESNVVIISANSHKFIKLKIVSENSIDSKYQMYYENLTNLNDLEQNNIHIGYNYLSKDVTSGNINTKEEKEILLTLINENNKDVEIKFGVEGGFTNDEIKLPLTKYPINKNNYLVDYSGNNYNGIFMNGAKVIYDDVEKMYALDLDGVDDYVQVPTLSETIDWENGFTIEYKAKLDELMAYSRIIHFNNQISNVIAISQYGDLKPIYFAFRNISENVNFFIAPSTSMKDNLHDFKIDFIRNGKNNTVNIYQDSTLILSGQTTDYVPNTTRDMNAIGYIIDGTITSEKPFDGRIYSLKITEADGDVILWYAPNL